MPPRLAVRTNEEILIGVLAGDPLTYVFIFNDTYLGAAPGTSGPCRNNTPAGGDCPGFLSAGDTFGVVLDTPRAGEHSSALGWSNSCAWIWNETMGTESLDGLRFFRRVFLG